METTNKQKGNALVFATQDSDGFKILENANIRGFETRQEAEEWLREPYAGALDEFESIRFAMGEYGDCWVKTMAAPDDTSRWLDPLTLNNVIVQRPGSHPGGRMYWVTPTVDVLVAIVEHA